MGRIRFALFSLLLFSAGCAYSDYIGRSYPATRDVEIFFRTEDIGREYEVMGEVRITGPTGEKIQAELLSVAREKGANAVFVVRWLYGTSDKSSSAVVEKKGEDGKKETVTVSTGGGGGDVPHVAAQLLKWK